MENIAVFESASPLHSFVFFAMVATVFTGVFLALLLSYFDWSHKPRSNMWVIALSAAVIQFYHALFVGEFLKIEQTIVIGFWSAITICGPAIYSQSVMVTSLDGRAPRGIWVYSPGFLLLGTEFFLVLDIALGAPITGLKQADGQLLNVQLALCGFTAIVYWAALAMAGYRVSAVDSFRKFALVMVGGAAVVSVLAPIGLFLKVPWLVLVAAVYITLHIGALIVAYFRYPIFFQTLRGTPERYTTTSLTNVDVAAIKQSLMSMMTDDCIYRDDTLRLADVAGELKIGNNQLSRIINEHYEQNFQSFVNSFRVEEARRLLLNEPSKSVLEIAYLVGFQSKSSFNLRFREATGLSPTRFRANGAKSK